MNITLSKSKQFVDGMFTLRV